MKGTLKVGNIHIVQLRLELLVEIGENHRKSFHFVFLSENRKLRVFRALTSVIMSLQIIFSPQKAQRGFQVTTQLPNSFTKQDTMLTLPGCASSPWRISWVSAQAFSNLFLSSVCSCLLHVEFLLHSSGSFLSPPKSHVSARSELIEPFFNK